jgi:hypothetical protein
MTCHCSCTAAGAAAADDDDYIDVVLCLLDFL